VVLIVDHIPNRQARDNSPDRVRISSCRAPREGPRSSPDCEQRIEIRTSRDRPPKFEQALGRFR